MGIIHSVRFIWFPSWQKLKCFLTMWIRGHIENVNPAKIPNIVIKIREYFRNSGVSRTSCQFRTSRELKLTGTRTSEDVKFQKLLGRPRTPWFRDKNWSTAEDYSLKKFVSGTPRIFNSDLDRWQILFPVYYWLYGNLICEAWFPRYSWLMKIFLSLVLKHLI